MIIHCSQPFVSSLLNEEDPYVIYQNMKWNVLKVVSTSHFDEWNDLIYEVEIEPRKQVDQLSLFNL